MRKRITSFLLTLALAVPVGMAAQKLTLTHGPDVEYVGSNKAEIAWTTNTGGSSIIHYGTDRNNLSQTAEEAYQKAGGPQHVTHRVTIKGLKPNTTYYFQVDSGQGQGTGSEAKSAVQSFTTKAAGGDNDNDQDDRARGAQKLTVTNGPNVEYAGRDRAQIAWTTSTGGSSIIHYGTDRNNLNQTAEEPYQRASSSQHVTHRVTITGLKPNTTYYFRVDSGQGQGTGTEAESQVKSFKTKG